MIHIYIYILGYTNSVSVKKLIGLCCCKKLKKNFCEWSITLQNHFVFLPLQSFLFLTCFGHYYFTVLQGLTSGCSAKIHETFQFQFQDVLGSLLSHGWNKDHYISTLWKEVTAAIEKQAFVIIIGKFALLLFLVWTGWPSPVSSKNGTTNNFIP